MVDLLINLNSQNDLTGVIIFLIILLIGISITAIHYNHLYNKFKDKLKRRR